jgi:hypothetical protein
MTEHTTITHTITPPPDLLRHWEDQLSPAAQAVLDAFFASDWEDEPLHANIAAALRAAADQVVPADPCGNDCCITQCEQIRADFLAIAAELEALDD